MTEKYLMVAFVVGIPTIIGLITRWSLTHDIIFRIWPPMIKVEKNEP